jgi:hypothetical protein
LESSLENSKNLVLVVLCGSVFKSTSGVDFEDIRLTFLSIPHDIYSPKIQIESSNTPNSKIENVSRSVIGGNFCEYETTGKVPDLPVGVVVVELARLPLNEEGFSVEYVYSILVFLLDVPGIERGSNQFATFFRDDDTVSRVSTKFGSTDDVTSPAFGDGSVFGELRDSNASSRERLESSELALGITNIPVENAGGTESGYSRGTPIDYDVTGTRPILRSFELEYLATEGVSKGLCRGRALLVRINTNSHIKSP